MITTTMSNAQHKRQRNGEEKPSTSTAAIATPENAEASSSAIPIPTDAESKPKKKAKTSKIKVPGIIYISRLPPGMTPQKVKHLMGRWGEVGKVYAQRKDGAYMTLV